MTLDLSRIQALCFDLDGTLSDTDDQFVHRLARWLTPIRFIFQRKDPLPFARWMVMRTEAPGNFALWTLDALGIDGYFHAIGNSLYRHGLGKTPEPFCMINGVQDMLISLAPHYPLCIVSARDKSSSERFLKQFNISSFFCCVATADTCRHTKPYPDPIFWAAQKMGVIPENCLMIGDTTVDIRAGKAAKAQTVGVLSGFGEEDELRNSGADIILSSVAELPKVLLRAQT
jgi:N-acetyl-D-muramate 6-phosphate phosphatase